MMQDQPDHSPWYQSRGPEIIMRGGEGFANSIGNGLDKLADGLGKFLESRNKAMKEEVAQGKVVDAFVRTDLGQKALADSNLTKEQISTFKPADKTAWMGAFIQNVATKKVLSDIDQNLAQVKAQKAQFEGFQQQNQQRGLDAAAFERYRTGAGKQTKELPPGRGFLEPPRHEQGRGALLEPPVTPAAPKSRIDLMIESGMNPDDINHLAQAYDRDNHGQGNNPLEMLKAETERKRVNAYAKSVDDQIAGDGKKGETEYAADDFKFDAAGNPTHWRVGDSFVKWNPKNQLVPGSKRGTVRVIPPPSSPYAAMFGGQPTADVPESAPVATTNAPSDARMDDFKAWLQKKQSK